MTKSTGVGRGHNRRTHGMSRSRTYNIWIGMRKRCSDVKDRIYHRYGGVGISVCERWNRFENFLEDMGDSGENMSIDRIDNKLGYSPENCRWATQKQQMRNTTVNRLLSFRGKTQSLAAWADEIGCSYRFLYRTYRMI
jgi:hypothetical protein